MSERSVDRWLERTVTRAGERLGRLRDHVFELAGVERHSTVLDLKAGTGLLTWEALRRASEGQVWALTSDETAAEAIRRMADSLPELLRPEVVSGSLEDIRRLVSLERFDVIVGRNVLAEHLEGSVSHDLDADLRSLFDVVRQVLAPDGTLVLAEPDTRAAQRLYRLVDLSSLSSAAEEVAAAEESIYAALTSPSPDVVAVAAEAAGLSDVKVLRRQLATRERVARETVNGWFEPGRDTPSYADHLRQQLPPATVAEVKSAFMQQLADRDTTWTVTYYLVTAGGSRGGRNPLV